MKNYKRLVSIFLCFVLSIAFLPNNAWAEEPMRTQSSCIDMSYLPFETIKPDYDMEYYNEKPLPSLTGDQAVDTAKIAESQIGYSGAYGTVYGAWWNTVTNWGVDYTYSAWCAMFACWCAYQAGAGLYVAYNEYGAGANYLFDFQKAYCTSDTSFYTEPRPGDFIYFGNNGYAEHVGVITSYDASNRIVYFVSGNDENTVKASSTPWYSGAYWGTQIVLGYGRPNYSSNAAYYLDVNGWLDGSITGDLMGRGTFDLYLNGSLKVNDANDFCEPIAVGTTYEIRDIKPNNGYSYNGIHSGSRKGTINGETIIELDFTTINTSLIGEPSKTKYLDGRMYQYYTDEVTWYTAKRFCEEQGGHLAVITSAQENELLYDIINSEPVWIGGSAITGAWKWVTGEPFSYGATGNVWPWNIGEPNNYESDEGGENYLQLTHSGWNDGAGYSLHGFLLEREPTAYLDIPDQYIEILAGETFSPYIGIIGTGAQYITCTVFSDIASGSDLIDGDVCTVNWTWMSCNGYDPNSSASKLIIKGRWASYAYLTIKLWNENNNILDKKEIKVIVKNNPITVSADKANIDLTLGTQESETVTIQTGGYHCKGFELYWENKKPAIATAKWGKWNDSSQSSIPLYISAVSEGTTIITVYPRDLESGKRIGDSKVILYVTVNANSIQTFTITYNANGGTGAPAAQTKTHGTALTLSTTKPTRDGYTFLGWAESKTATSAQYQPGGQFTKDADTTLYAVWSEQKCGDNLHWSLSADGVLTISGTGDMYDFDWNTMPWYQDKNIISKIEIQSGVAGIGTCAFYYCENVTNASVPDSVARIGDLAFCGCSKLKQISLSGALTVIQNGIFSNCTSLNRVDIYCPIRFMYCNVFENCENLSVIELPDMLESIHVNSFHNCPKLKTVYYKGSRSQWQSILIQADNEALESATINYGKYDLFFDANGGTDAPNAETVPVTYTHVITTEKPNRAGYTFLGWSEEINAANAQYQPGGKITPTHDTTLYAVWQKNETPPADGLTLRVGSVSGTPGSEVRVPITLENNPGIAYLKFKVSYDATRLTLTGFENGALSGWTGGAASGGFGWDDVQDSAANGTVLTLVFQINADAQEGSAAVTLTNSEAYHFNESIVGVNVSSGGVSVTTRIPGDVTHDGTVNGQDLLRLRKHLIGMSVDADLSAADVTGDGAVDGRDLLRLRKHLIGMDVVLLGEDGDAELTAEGTLTLGAPTDALVPGETFEVPVTLSDAGGVAYLSFRVSYDKTRFRLVDFVEAGLTGWTADAGGSDGFEWDDVQDAAVSGKILTLRFEVLSAAPLGTGSITVEQLEAFNFNETAVPIQVKNTNTEVQTASIRNPSVSGGKLTATLRSALPVEQLRVLVAAFDGAGRCLGVTCATLTANGDGTYRAAAGLDFAAAAAKYRVFAVVSNGMKPLTEQKEIQA